MHNRLEYPQITDLMTCIEKAAFKIALDREKSSERSVKIKVFNPPRVKGRPSYRRVPIWKSDINKNDADELVKIVRLFIREIAEKIWNHIRMIKNPRLVREFLLKHKERENNVLYSIEKLLGYRGYRSETIERALQPLRDELNTHINWALKSKEFRSEVEIKGDALVHMENSVIKEIKLLYKKEIFQAGDRPQIVSLFNTDLSLNRKILNKDGSPKLVELSDREIASNMAIIFSATGFWGDNPSDRDISNKEELKEDRRRVNYFWRIRKRPPFKERDWKGYQFFGEF